jgi:DNA mismatch repair protein MutS
MQIDQTTFQDLSIFHAEEEYSVFHRINLTRTTGGRDCLLKCFLEPFSTVDQVVATQGILKMIISRMPEWPMQVTNGTLLVLEKFLDYNLDPLPRSADGMNSYLYRLLHSPDFSLARFSLTHFHDFVTGMKTIVELLEDPAAPAKLLLLLSRARMLLQNPELEELCKRPAGTSFTVRETVRFGHFIHEKFRHHALELVQLYSQLDAWYGMAAAVERYGLCFPELTDSEDPYFRAEGLYHILLAHPVPYGLEMTPNSNFIFLTGANMAGKSTFIKSVGLAVFLAHIGMGVPATSMQLSLFDGILSNINVADNIARGESYFFNEVQRIKNTVLRISDNRRWLVLIDELFKGTNIQDAMKCSSTVIRGLIKIRHAFFILSTHLYEIGEELKAYPNISFRFFETMVHDDQLEFSYQLRDGISNDRLGYLILKREKVTDLLDRL